MNNSIRKFRLQKGYSQDKLAVIVGCCRETVSNLETGRYNPSWELIYRIARALDVCPCVLMLPDTPILCDDPFYYLIE